MASAKRKRSHSSAPPARRSSEGITLTGKQISWILGTLASLLAVAYGWTQLWDRIETHWRLESVQQSKEQEQKARDEKIEAALKSERTQSEQEIKALAKRAEQGRAWLFWSVIDGRAVNTEQFAEICKSLKRPGEVCTKFERDAMQYRQEAQEAKRAASEAGREK